MKVLFAVNNDEISNAIVKRYQKDYKEILSYKNVYYFNAILKELQKDKNYDRVVISEDLEPFANNNYDTIDKFLFEKLDNISDETTGTEGKNTEIILICTDRRNKSDDMLVKIFGIGIYSAMIGQDRSIEEVCRLINKPRTKKEAKQYYKIEVENVGYQSESEDSVSETEVQNILAHYKRLGKNEDKYVESFNNIVSQYTDAQLKIIIRYLPISVKAVLEEKSPKYQQLVSYSVKSNEQSLNKNNKKNTESQKNGLEAQMLENESVKGKMTKPIIIPSKVNASEVKKLIKEEKREEFEPEEFNIEDFEEEEFETDDFELEGFETEKIETQEFEVEEIEKNINEEIQEVKRKRGRPRKNPPVDMQKEDKPKRGRGRPRKNPIVEEKEPEEDFADNEVNDDNEADLFNLVDSKDENIENEQEIDLFNLDDGEDENIDDEQEIDLFGLDHSEDENIGDEQDVDLFGLDNSEDENDDEQDVDLFNLDDSENDEQEVDSFSPDDNEETTEEMFDFDEKKTNINEENNSSTEIENVGYKAMHTSDINTLLTKDKKIVAFVGTTKNGTSFVVNNAAHMLASMGIKTAVLDITKTRNSYYIYTNSEEKLMDIARKSINKLRSGIAEGIEVNKNLTIYTTVPDDETEYNDVDSIVATLLKNYSVVLIDCDFDTPAEYFSVAQEIYLVQSMDVLTIQPLTAFLRDLQSKGVLKQEKIKIVINKSVNIRSVSVKTLIGGISKYNDPSLTIMKDLFDKDKVSYCSIPFETQNYIKYLDSLITCNVSMNGYTKSLIAALKELCGMIYPLISKPVYSPRGDKYKDNFSNQMNDTLNKMKRKYQ